MPCHIFAGHDLDEDNQTLLVSRAMTFALHHDLKADARAIFRTVLGILAKSADSRMSAVEVITRYNMR